MTLYARQAHGTTTLALEKHSLSMSDFGREECAVEEEWALAPRRPGVRDLDNRRRLIVRRPCDAHSTTIRRPSDGRPEAGELRTTPIERPLNCPPADPLPLCEGTTSRPRCSSFDSARPQAAAFAGLCWRRYHSHNKRTPALALAAPHSLVFLASPSPSPSPSLSLLVPLSSFLSLSYLNFKATLKEREKKERKRGREREREACSFGNRSALVPVVDF